MQNCKEIFKALQQKYKIFNQMVASDIPDPAIGGIAHGLYFTVFITFAASFFLIKNADATLSETELLRYFLKIKKLRDNISISQYPNISAW